MFDGISAGAPAFALVDTPPQHGKTAIIIYSAVRHLLLHPGESVVFATYNQAYALKVSRHARDIAKAVGLKLTSDAIASWGIDGGGSFSVTGVGGALTGWPGIKLIIVDDPYKNREEAESPLMRNKIADWFSASAVSRLSPGMSLVVCHTRWHDDDLIGRLSKLRGEALNPDDPNSALANLWQRFHFPAICMEEGDPFGRKVGEALWPERKPVAWLESTRRTGSISDYDWWSMWMGSPRPKGGALFDGVSYYDELPTRYRIAIGVDLAYTAKTHADYSVALVLACASHPTEVDKEGKPRPIFYVVDVIRRQVQAPDFADALKLLNETYPGSEMVAYAYGPEMGNVHWLRRNGVDIKGKSKTGDKFVRAQPVSAGWNHGDVLVPRTRRAVDPRLVGPKADTAPEWLGEFLAELKIVTGIGDVHDDQMDALAPAYDWLLAKRRTASGAVSGGRYVPGQSLEERPLGI